MHYDFTDIVEAAQEENEYGKLAKIALKKGDTAYAPGTTKKVLAGVGHIHYFISPTGTWVTYQDESIFLQYKEIAPKA